MRAAIFRITLDGRDLSDKFRPRLVSLTLTECRGGEADQLDIALDDTDGKLAIPPKGAKIALQIGWNDTGLVDKGNFTVDEVGHSGTPDVLTLRARTADLIDNFRQVKERSFHDTTVGDIIKTIAAEHDLRPGVAPFLAGKKIAHVDQTQESDAAFLRRLGKQYDAVATVKNDTLLFIPASQSKTVSGKDLPIINIQRKDGDHHHYSCADRDSYSGVRAYWYDQKMARRRSVVAGIPGNSKRLRTTFANERDALAAATAEWNRIQRGIGTFTLTLADARPDTIPQSPVEVSGFKPDIDATTWICVKVTHTMSDTFTTHIEAETKTEEAATAADIEDYEKDPDEGVTGVLASWRDKATKKSGQELAGSKTKPKTLSHTYSSKASANRAAKLEWAKITERREVMADNAR